MDDTYEIRLMQDDIYGVYVIGIDGVKFTGTLVEVEAWLSLKEKGFDI